MSGAAALAAPSWSERAYQGVLTGALAALGFFLIFSTAGTALSLFVLLVLCLLAPGRIWRQAPWREPVLALGLALLAYVALRTFVGEGLRPSSAGIVNNYHELLMLPLLWALLRLAQRPHAFMAGLFAGALFFAGLNWLAPFVPWAADFLFTRRISGGFGLAVCAFLLFEQARLGAVRRGPGYAGAAFLAATVLFAGDSRTAHVVLLLLAGCAAWRAAPRRWRLPAAAAMLVCGALLASLSPHVRERIVETVDAAEASRQGQVEFTSSGARIELVRNSLAVAREHWLLGTGWQGFEAAFAQAAAERRMHSPHGLGTRSDNPHNEYLMQLAGGGLPALALFLLWLAWPMWRAVREPAGGRAWVGVMGCVALAFAVGSLFNSLLLDFIEGHFYGALLAWLLARQD